MSTGRKPRVVTAMTMLKQMLYRLVRVSVVQAVWQRMGWRTKEASSRASVISLALRARARPSRDKTAHQRTLCPTVSSVLQVPGSDWSCSRSWRLRPHRTSTLHRRAPRIDRQAPLRHHGIRFACCNGRLRVSVEGWSFGTSSLWSRLSRIAAACVRSLYLSSLPVQHLG
jgi:hypothetical protein